MRITIAIGDRKYGICLRLHGQKSSSPYAVISALVDSKGRAFVLIQVLYIYNYVVLGNAIWTKLFPTVRFFGYIRF